MFFPFLQTLYTFWNKTARPSSGANALPNSYLKNWQAGGSPHSACSQGGWNSLGGLCSVYHGSCDETVPSAGSPNLRITAALCGERDGLWHAHQVAGPPPDTMPVPEGCVGSREVGGGAESAGLYVCLWPLFISRGAPPADHHPAAPHPSVHTKL